MEDLDLKKLWKTCEGAIEESKVLNLQSWAVNFQTFEYIQTHKAKSRLRSLATFKGWAIFGGILWLLLLGVLLVGNHGRNLYFTVSVGMILLFTLLAIATYIKHIVLIRKIDYSENVVETQQRLSELQASTINITRILFLQTPFYSTFFWSPALIDHGNIRFLLIAVPITVLLTIGSIWLYRNIALRNAGKKWFRILFGNIEWTSIIKAMEYLKEIEEFKSR